jgi:tetratricopeptide (TPR) repeat protein
MGPMRGLPLVLLLAACASAPRSNYVPGAPALASSSRSDYRRAVAKEREGDAKGALAILDELAVGHPLELGIHLHRLRLAQQVRGTDAAVALYEPGPPGVDPEVAAILAALARTPEEDIAARTSILEAAAAREPGNAFWRLGLADVRLAAHDVVVVRAEEQRSLGRVEESRQSYFEAARLAEEARQDAETALQYDPTLAEAHVLLGFLWTRKADLLPQRDRRDEMRSAADYHYREALKLDPANLGARINLAENLIHFGRYSDAIDELEVALKIGPREPLAWNNLGYCAYSTGQLGQAVDYYEQALVLAPRDARIRTALADVLRRLDKSKEAVAALEQARKDSNGDRSLEAEIAFKLAAIHEYERRYGDAVKEYQLHIDLGGPDAAKAKSRIRHIYEDASARG